MAIGGLNSIQDYYNSQMGLNQAHQLQQMMGYVPPQQQPEQSNPNPVLLLLEDE